MADLTPRWQRFDRMVRDESRDQLPDNACWNMVDYIPGELDAPLGKRGGWSYASQLLTNILASADFVTGLVYAEFAAGAQLVATVRNDPVNTERCGQIVSSSSTTDRGNCNAPTQNPVYYRDLVIIPHHDGTQILDAYNGTSNVADLSATAPAVKWCVVYKDRLAAAANTSQLQRVYFSPAGDPDGTWDTATSYIDSSAAVTGLWPMRNALLVFHRGSLERITGAIPPPGSDMNVQPVWNVGCTDIRSAAGTDDFVVFANNSGVYLSDGSAVVDIAEKGGMSSYWQEVVEAAGTSLTIGAGIFRGHYFVAIRSGTTFYDAFCVRLSDYAWSRISNLTAICFASRYTGFEELYWGDYSEARANTISGLFSPAAANKNDGDGTAVTPVMETPFRRFTGKGRIKHVFFDYDLRDAATDNPLLTASYVTTPESTSYTTVKRLDGSTSDTMAETTVQARVRRRVAEQMLGVGLKVAQTNASAVTKLYRIGIEGHELEPSRR